MRALVVYESMFANTRQIAKAVAVGLSARMDVAVVEVSGAPSAVPDDVALLVVGAPTHAFGLSRPGTRRSAAEQAGAGLVSTGIGVREWLEDLRPGSDRTAVAAFDTRVRKPQLPGSAARGAAKRLRRLGFRLVADAESFYVGGTAGPVVDGEPERARAWGSALAGALSRSG